MIAAVTMVFQNAATNGEGLTQFLPEPRTVRFRVTGNGSVSAGAVTIECCPSMTPTPLPGSGAGSGSGSGSGTTWTSLTTIIVPANATTEYRADSVVGSVRARISTPITGGTVTVLGIRQEDQKGWSRCPSPLASSSG